MSARPDESGDRLVALVERSRPDVVRLAEAVSLAVRIEPAIVRRARLVLEPSMSVGTEADLWFSPLVETYSPRALALRPDVARVLRTRLVRDPDRCRGARSLVRELHEDAPHTIRLEEEMLYLALIGEDHRIDELLEPALNTMFEVQDRADAVARWATRTLPSLPDGARGADVARALASGAQVVLRTGFVEVGLELMPDGITVSEPPTGQSHHVSLPDEEPIMLSVRPAGAPEPVWSIAVERGRVRTRRIRLPRRSAPGLDVETVDGRLLELRPRPQAEPPRRPSAPAIDLRDLQGDILRAYGNDYDRTSYAFVKIECQPEQAQAWFGGLLDHVTTAEPWPGSKPLTTLNVAVTAAGLQALGVSDDAIGSFSHEFREGMAGRAPQFGDDGPSHPREWERGLGTGEAHVLLTINAQQPEGHQRALGKMREAMEAAGGLRIVHQQDTQLLQGAREHFGFADGFAQPAIEGSSNAKAPGGGVPLGGGRWRALAAGEFVLGYPDEETREDPRRRLPSAPVDPLGRSGTYMVWRKLQQQVALWRRVLHDAARYYDADGDPQRLAAKVIGRWPDGTPLVTHPDGRDPGLDPTAWGGNDFRYGDDLDGRRCPLGAHIRRANPRDALGFDGALTLRHRMIRRGMPYGPPLPDGVMSDDGVDRGLVFVSFQASISRQFEAVQMQWLNDGNIFGLGHDSDFVLGRFDGRGKMTIHGDPPFFLAPQEAFVRTLGGEYLFVPGMSALLAIAEGTAG